MSITGVALTGLGGEQYTVGAQVHANQHGDAVYEGLLRGEQRVAIKAVLNRKADYSTDSWYAEARHIDREWEVSEKLRTFKHEHLMLIDDRCSYADTGRDLTCYVMPWADKTLAELLGTLDDAEVLEVVQQLATGLEELGAAGVVHRDIKPSNALLWEGRWRLSDFGTASLGSMHQTFTFVGTGTAFYRAPEVLLGHDETPLSDIYSLGCLTYALRTGSPPFQGSNNGGRTETMTSFPADIDDMDQFLGILIRRMLAKNPIYRPQSAAEIIALCRRETKSPFAQRLAKLEADFTRRQAELDIVESIRAHRTELLARSVADLEHLIALAVRSLQEYSPNVGFNQDDQSSAWVIELFGHRLTIALASTFEQIEDLICIAVIQSVASVDDSNSVATTVANLICTEVENSSTAWSLVRFNANPDAVHKVGQVGLALGLQGEELLMAWNRRTEPAPPAVLLEEPLSSEVLIDLLLSHMEGTATTITQTESGNANTQTTGRAGASEGLKYEAKIQAALQEIFHHDMKRLAERDGIDFEVRTAMGRTSIEAKYLKSGKFSIHHLHRAAAAMKRLGSKHGLVVVTNAFLTPEVREANQRGTIDGIAIEALTWNGPEDSPLLSRAVARSAR